MNTAIPTPAREALGNIHQDKFWLQLNRDLTITDNPFRSVSTPYAIPANEMTAQVKQMKKEGYLQTRPVIDPTHLKNLTNCIDKIVAAGLPPVFAFVYDEFWQLYQNLSNVLAPVFGGDYTLSPNIWAWYVYPDDNDAGFKPHRDYNRPDSVSPEGLPLIGTVWIPLTDVDTLTSCLYVLPTHRDPNFPHNISETNISYSDLQSIRALPAKAGSVLSWNTHLLHWGGRSSKHAIKPRISIAIYISRKGAGHIDSYSINPSLHFPLEYRLAVISQVILHYATEPLSYELLNSKQLHEFCKTHIGKLDELRKQAVVRQQNS